MSFSELGWMDSLFRFYYVLSLMTIFHVTSHHTLIVILNTLCVYLLFKYGVPQL